MTNKPEVSRTSILDMLKTPPKDMGEGDSATTPPNKVKSGLLQRLLNSAVKGESTERHAKMEATQEKVPTEPAVGSSRKRLQRQVNENKHREEERKKAAELLEANAGKFVATHEEFEEPCDAVEEVEDETWDYDRRLQLAERAWSHADGGSATHLNSPLFDPATAIQLHKSGEIPFRLIASALENGAKGPECMLRVIANLIRLVLHNSKSKEANLRAVFIVFLSGGHKVPHRQLVQAVASAFGLKFGTNNCQAPESDLPDIALSARLKQRVLFQKCITVADVATVLEETKTDADQVPEHLSKLVGGSVAEGRETWHLIRVLQRHVSFSRNMLLRALAHATILLQSTANTALPSCSTERAQCEAMVSMEDVILRNFSLEGGNMGKIVKALLSGMEPTSLATLCGPTVGVPVFPMKAEVSKDVPAALVKLGGGAMLAEWLIQGKRAQVHVQDQGAIVNVFINDQGMCRERTDEAAKLLAGQMKNVDTCILEVIFVKSKKVTAKNVVAKEEEHDQHGASSHSLASTTMIVFDILLLNGMHLTDRTLRERRVDLFRILDESAYLKFARGSEIVDPSEVQAKLDEALSASYLASDEEKASSKTAGLILKSLDGPGSIYFAGRCHPSWQALEKPPVTGPEAEKLLFDTLSEEERTHLVPKDAFHFTVVSGFRTRSVEGVNDILRIQKSYNDAGVVPTWYVDNECPDEYRKLGLKVVQGGKLIPSRNKALEDAVQAGKVCVQTSDDIGCWQFFQDENRYHTNEEANAAYKRANKFNISPVAAARYLLARMRARGDKCRLGGVYPLPNGGRACCAASVGLHHFILGDFFVSEISDCRFDERLSLKEDYDYTASHLAKYGEVFRCNRLLITAKHETNAGGACDARDAEGKKEQYNIRILKEKWPNAILDHPTRANQIIMRWKLPKDDTKQSVKLQKPMSTKRKVGSEDAQNEGGIDISDTSPKDNTRQPVELQKPISTKRKVGSEDAYHVGKIDITNITEDRVAQKRRTRPIKKEDTSTWKFI